MAKLCVLQDSNHSLIKRHKSNSDTCKEELLSKQSNSMLNEKCDKGIIFYKYLSLQPITNTLQSINLHEILKDLKEDEIGSNKRLGKVSNRRVNVLEIIKKDTKDIKEMHNAEVMISESLEKLLLTLNHKYVLHKKTLMKKIKNLKCSIVVKKEIFRLRAAITNEAQ